eukprot:m.71168 g.71168  ORF g.71168 m.71168 type:complete len:311 (+) comp12285_c0_seq1:151-1083(+)
MLSTALSNLGNSKLIVLADAPNHTALPLLEFVVHKALSLGNQIVGIDTERTTRHGGEFDRVIWYAVDWCNNNANSAVEQCTAAATNGATIVIDSMSSFASLVGERQALKYLKKWADSTAVLCIMHSTATPFLVQSTLSIAHTVTQLQVTEPQCRARVEIKEQTGKVKVATVYYQVHRVDRASGPVQLVLTEERVSTGIKVAPTAPVVPQESDASDDPTANLTFNLKLSEQEKKARANISLPYEHTGQSAPSTGQPAAAKSGTTAVPVSASGNTPASGGSSGQKARSGVIYYEPDEVDDFDDEDPDDDLDL